MAEIIELPGRESPVPDDLICRSPLEFRKAEWGTGHFVQMLKSQSEKLGSHREEVFGKGGKAPWNLPPHYSLQGGMAGTIQALFLSRRDEKRMREIYYLAGLIDCMINQVHHILRTDLLRDMYKKVFALKAELNVRWYGTIDQVLLPIDPWFFSEAEYRASLRNAETMQKLYQGIRTGTDEMFDILALEYVFYCPGVGG